MFTLIIHMVYIFFMCWLFALLCRNFLVWCSLTCLFLLLLSVLWCHIQKIIAPPMSRSFSPIFFSRSCRVSGLIFKSLIYFVLIFVSGERQGSNFIFCMWISSFPNIIYWRDHSFCIVCLAPLSKINWPYTSGLISRLSILLTNFLNKVKVTFKFQPRKPFIAHQLIIYVIKLKSDFERSLQLLYGQIIKKHL